MTDTNNSSEIVKGLDQRKKQFDEALAAMKASLMEEGSLTRIIESHPPYVLLAECFLIGFSIREKLKQVKEHA